MCQGSFFFVRCRSYFSEKKKEKRTVFIAQHLIFVFPAYVCDDDVRRKDVRNVSNPYEIRIHALHSILVPYSSSHKSCSLFLRIYKLPTSIRLVFVHIYVHSEKKIQKFCKKKKTYLSQLHATKSDSSPMFVSFSSSPICHLRLSSMLLNNEYTQPRHTYTQSVSHQYLQLHLRYVPSAASHSHVNTGNIAWNVQCNLFSTLIRFTFVEADRRVRAHRAQTQQQQQQN